MKHAEKIPADLCDCPQWVCYKLPRKIPFDPKTNKTSSSTDRTTWGTFSQAVEAMARDQHDVIGFCFSPDDPYVGIDLDGCRNPENGIIEPWAKRIIKKLNSYAEVSPSHTGVKIFVKGESPYRSGRKFENLIVEAPHGVDKKAAIEVYDHGRYFCVTGMRLSGFDAIQVIDAETIKATLEEFVETHDAPKYAAPSLDGDQLFERARKYVSMMPAAVSGSGGDMATFRVACALVAGFGL